MDFRKADHNYRTVGQTGAGVQQSAQYDVGLRAYMLKVYNYMAVALFLTGAVAFGASTSEALMTTIFNTPLRWVVMFAPLGVVIYLSAKVHSMTTSRAQTWFWVYSGLVGLSLAYIFLAYTGESIARTFFITGATYAGVSLFGYTTKKDLSGFGTFLLMGLIGILIASVVNMFLGSPGMQFAISVLGVLIFAGLTAYDTQRIKNSYYQFGAHGNAAVMGALSLYLDFINLFVMMLHFLGERR